APFLVEEQQRIRAVLDQRPEPLFAGTERRFGLPALPLADAQGEREPYGAVEGLDREVRLAQVIGGAGLHRFDGDVLGAVPGEQNQGGGDAALLQLAQQLETVARAEHVVDDGEVVERRGGEFGERRFVRRRNLDFGVRPLPARAQELHHHLRVLDRIVDDEQTSHDRRGGPGRGAATRRGGGGGGVGGPRRRT